MVDPTTSLRDSEKRTGRLPISSLSCAGIEKLGKFLTISLLILAAAQVRGVAAIELEIYDDTRICPIAIWPCTCKFKTKGSDVVCDNANEREVLQMLAALKSKSFVIYWMKIRNSVLPRIKDYTFLGLDVRHLNIIRSNVSVLEESAMAKIGVRLADLALSNNEIQAIPTLALSKINSLNFLNLNYNKIKEIHSNAFRGLEMLERLSLYGNQINHIHENAFIGLRSLSRLNLGKNKLTAIPSNTFHSLNNLLVLVLNENSIKDIPPEASKGLHKLDMLKLEHNEIDAIQDDVFSDLTMLNSLNIEHNRIVKISKQAFKGLGSKLGWLELGHNLLDHIPTYALRRLKNLRQLDLDSNMISKVGKKAFKNYGSTLKYLLMDRNVITEIHPLAFQSFTSLEWLKLSHNELSVLTLDTTMPILDTIKHLDISDNPLLCNCWTFWLYEWLKNPDNLIQVESINEHRCFSQKDYRMHNIRFLTEDYFTCD